MYLRSSFALSNCVRDDKKRIWTNKGRDRVGVLALFGAHFHLDIQISVVWNCRIIYEQREQLKVEQHRQCKYNVILWRVCVTILAT